MDAIARPKDDLFDNSTMTFGEHLEELRHSLVRAIIWLMIGLAVGLVFANRVVRYVQAPLKEAIAEFRVDRDLTRLGWDKDDKSLAPMRKFMMNEALVAELVYELPGEVASQLAIGPPTIGPPPIATDDSEEPANEDPSNEEPASGAPAESGQPEPVAVEGGESSSENEVSSEGDDEAAIQTDPPAQVDTPAQIDTPAPVDPPAGRLPSESREVSAAEVLMAMGPQLDPEALAPRVLLRRSEEGLSSLKVEESFMIWVKAGLIVGAVLASPMIFYHLWSFVAAGLHAHERRYVYIYLPFSVLLFVSGVSLAFFLVLQYVLSFLLTFNAGMDVAVEPRLTYYVNFVLLLPLGFGIAFQLPLVMLFLQRIDLVQTDDYIRSWRIAILVIFLISMLVTPADVTSMVALAVPLMLLYFLGIVMCLYMPRGRGLGSGAYDPA